MEKRWENWKMSGSYFLGGVPWYGRVGVQIFGVTRWSLCNIHGWLLWGWCNQSRGLYGVRSARLHPMSLIFSANYLRVWTSRCAKSQPDWSISWQDGWLATLRGIVRELYVGTPLTLTPSILPPTSMLYQYEQLLVAMWMFLSKCTHVHLQVDKPFYIYFFTYVVIRTHGSYLGPHVYR